MFKWLFEKRKAPIITSERDIAVCAHECGHALIGANSVGGRPLSMTIEFDPKTGLAGKVEMSNDKEFFAGFPAEYLKEQMMQDMGGMAGELIVTGKFRTKPAKADLAHAVAIARLMLECFHRLTIDGLFRPSVTHSGPDFGAYFRRRPEEEVVDLLNRGFRYARAYIETHRAPFDRLQADVIRHKALNEDGLKPHIDACPKAFLFHPQ